MRIKREISLKSTISKFISALERAEKWMDDKIKEPMDHYKRFGTYGCCMDVIRGYSVICAEIDGTPWVRLSDGDYLDAEGKPAFNHETFDCGADTTYVLRGFSATRDNKALLFLEMYARFVCTTAYRCSGLDFLISRAPLIWENGIDSHK